MPSIRSLVFKRCTLLTISISLNGEIINPYSRCVKKGLVYITIIALSSRQPSSYFKYTKANTCSSYNICLMSINEYIS
jgi:hypothetical protein